MDSEARQVIADALRAAGRDDMADALRWFEAMAPHVDRVMPFN